MSGNDVIATQNVGNGVFSSIDGGCYRLVICVTNTTGTYYCCKDLPCGSIDLGCCELKYAFSTSITDPHWQFGDNTTSNLPNPVHEYTNINTYPGEGTPQTTVTLAVPFSTTPIQSVVQFPEGIWVGQDCVDSGNGKDIPNSVNPALSVFPVSSYSNRNISVKGSITMSVNYNFTNTDFCMHPSARIVITGKQVSFLGGTVLHEAECKTDAWYGIEVRRGTLVGNDATFTGAYNAIRTPVNPTLTPDFSLTNCRFNRNYVGMNLNSPVTFAAFTGNTFGLEAGAAVWPGLAPNACPWVTFINKASNSRPFAGIYAETHAGQTVTSFTLTPAVQNNLFTNIANGIYLQDANALIRRCQFRNMLVGAYPNDDGFGVALFTGNFRTLEQWGLGKNSSTLTFDNCRHAVYVSLQGAGNVQIRSFLNHMANVVHGYTLLGNGAGTFRANSLIQNNQVNYTGIHGIYVWATSVDTRLTIALNRIATNTSNSNGTGILLLGNPSLSPGSVPRVSVLNNFNDGVSGDGVYNGSDGISVGAFNTVLVQNNTVSDFSRFGVLNVNGANSNIRCNVISSAAALTEAVRNNTSPNVRLEYNQTNASNRGLVVTNICSNSTVSCNQIGSHGVGLYYDGTAETGAQLLNGTSAGNTWIGTYTNWAAFNGSVNFTNSRYFYRIGEINPAQVSPNFLLPNDWFRQVTAGVTCASGCPQVMSPAERSVTELDTKVADGSLAPGGLSGYLLKRFLYNDLLYYPQLIQNSATLQNFQTSFGATNGGKLVSVEKAVADAFRLTSQQQSQWDVAASNLESAFSQLVILDSLVQNGADPETQEAQRNALYQQIQNNQTTLQGLYVANLNARLTGASTIQQMLSSVSPQAQWETNEKTLNEIFLNTSFVDASANTTQTDQIRQIAEQCSADGGPAVHRARAWYYSLTGTRIEVNCGGVIEREAETPTNGQIQLLVSPNPAVNKALIRWSNIALQTGQLEIFDMTGRLDRIVEVPENSTSVEVATAGLSNGIYFCRLTQHGLFVAATKFSIQH